MSHFNLKTLGKQAILSKLHFNKRNTKTKLLTRGFYCGIINTDHERGNRLTGFLLTRCELFVSFSGAALFLSAPFSIGAW